MKKQARHNLMAIAMMVMLVGILTCGAMATNGGTIQSAGDNTFTVTYDGSASQPDGQYIVLGVKKDVAPANLTDDDILYIDQTVADNEGKFSFTVKPKSNESFDVYLGGSFTSLASPLKIGTVAKVAITQEPEDVTKAAGETATYTVQATGENLKYQWQYWNKSTNAWAEVNDDWGGKTATMSFKAWAGGNGLSFRCVVWRERAGSNCSAS